MTKTTLRSVHHSIIKGENMFVFVFNEQTFL